MSIVSNTLKALTAPVMRRWKSGATVDLIDQSIGNGYAYTFRDNADANDVLTLAVDEDNQLRVGDSVYTPERAQATCHLFPNGNLVTTAFFTNCTPRPLVITGVQMVMTTAGTVSGASCTVTHEAQSGGLMQAAGTGKAVLSGAFNMQATAATVQVGSLATGFFRQTRNNSVLANNPGSGLIVLQPGDALSIVPGGTLTTAAGLTITLTLSPGDKYHFVSYYAAAAAAVQTLSLMTSLRPRTLLAAAALWQVAETATGTLTLDVSKDASGTAPGGGTSMLSATANLKGTALTYTQLGLSATAANLLTAPTDSVAVHIGGTATPTAIAGVLLTLAFNGTQNEVQIDYNPQNSTVGTNEEFWIADRDYEVLDFSGKWSTAGSSATVAATADTGTNTPSSGGVVLQTDNTNAGFLTSGTINTPVFAALATRHNLLLRKGDRLGLKNGGTLGSLAGFQASFRLRAA